MTDIETSIPPAPPIPPIVVNLPIVKYASFFRRMIATLIDGLILGIIGSVISTSLGRNAFDVGEETNNLASIDKLLTLLITIAYFVGFWVKQNGQTIGKRAMHIRVIKENDEPIDPFTAIIRYFSTWLSAFVLCLGYIWVIFDKKKQSWHDKIAKTYVIEADDQKPSKLIYAIGCFLPLLGFLAIIGLVATGMFVGLNEAKKGGSSEFVQELEKQKLLPKLTQEEADKLASDVFQEVNSYRQENNLQPLINDVQLCAYAQRRLEQLSAFGKYDDRKGFYEDTANSQILKAYFGNYKEANETTFILTGTTNKTTIINIWKSVENPLITKPNFSGGCIRANTQFLQFILGIK